MAILFIEGFEHQTANNILTGWGNGPQVISTLVNGTGYGVRSGQFSATGGFRYFNFRSNISAGRPIRCREFHCNGAMSVSSDSRSNPLIGHDGGVNGSGGFRFSAQTIVATRGFVTLGSTAFSYSFDTFYPFKMSSYTDNTAGQVDVYIGDEAVPTLSVTGVDTQQSGQNYCDGMGIVAQNFQSILRLDDMVCYAPSLILEVTSGAVSIGDAVTVSGGATMTVSDVDTTPDTPVTASGGGSILRIWVHRWDGTEIADGETVTAGTLVGATVRAPNANFRGGFEPWSWPQYEAVVGMYVTRQEWTANGTVNLTPVGSATNVENIDNVPLNTSAYNEATSGSALSDTYNTPAALPAGVGSIRGIGIRAACETFGTYLTHEMTLTDGSGSQVVEHPLPVTSVPTMQFAELDSAAAAWGTTLPTSGTYDLKP